MLNKATNTYRRRSVTSKDGTTIGYREFGHGPGLVIMHGGALASQHYMKLGGMLADQYTVCLPDRRGRGMSGPYGPNYTIEREDEDRFSPALRTHCRRSCRNSPDAKWPG